MKKSFFPILFVIILTLSIFNSCADPGIQFARRIETDRSLEHTALVFENEGTVLVNLKIYRPGKVFHEFSVTPGMTFRMTVAPGDARIEIKPGKRIFTIKLKSAHRYYFSIGSSN